MTGALRIDKTIMVAGINPTDGSNELLSLTTYDPPAERIDGIYMLAGIAPDGSNVLLRLNSDGTLGSSGGGGLSGSGVTNQITFWSSASVLTSDATMVWDPIASGIHVGPPRASLDASISSKYDAVPVSGLFTQTTADGVGLLAMASVPAGFALPLYAISAGLRANGFSSDNYITTNGGTSIPIIAFAQVNDGVAATMVRRFFLEGTGIGAGASLEEDYGLWFGPPDNGVTNVAMGIRIDDYSALSATTVQAINYASKFIVDKDGNLLLTNYMEYTEMVAPAAPAANKARLFSRDSGGGKTQLCVIFPTGAVQVVATEP